MGLDTNCLLRDNLFVHQANNHSSVAAHADLKTCRRCLVEKPLSGFWRDRRRPDGRQTACIDCQKASSAEFHARNPGYAKRKGAERYQRIGKSQNRERYSKDKEAFLRRRAAVSLTARGRVMGLVSAARLRAKRAGMAFDIDHDFVLDLWEAQQGTCSLTGIEFELQRNPNGARFYHPYAPSLDREDAQQGYTRANTRLVCVIVNLALNCFGTAAFDRMCKARVERTANAN